MVRYRVKHQTEYRYSETVSVCQNQVLLKPTETAGLRCLHHRLRVEPTATFYSSYFDYFGNSVQSFAIEHPHRRLLVQADSTVEVAARAEGSGSDAKPWRAAVQAIRDGSDPRWFEAIEYTFDSPMVRRGAPFAEYARQLAAAGDSVFTLARQLTSHIHTDFRYDTTASEVTTPPEQAIVSRRGVCQDFAHVQIACLRSLGIPVRYVSGYLRTIPPAGQPRLVGADQSHAWVAVYCGPRDGWVEFDPTNDCVCSTDHIALAQGRDYQDVAPMRGVMLGGGTHQLAVSVDVALIEA